MLANKMFRVMRLYNVCAMIILLCGLSGSLYYFWASGQLNGQYTSSLLEAKIVVNQLLKKDRFTELKHYAESFRRSLLKKEIDFMQKDIVNLNKNLTVKGKLNSVLEESLLIKSSLSNLSAQPRIDSILGVFKAKISKFEAFVVKNRWKTLTRISSRINRKITKLDGLNYGRLKYLIRSIKQDFSIIGNVTETSILSREDKAVILLKVKGMQTELQLMEKVLAAQGKFIASLAKLSQVVQRDLQEVNSFLTLERLNLNEKNKYFMYSLFALIAFLLCYFVFYKIIMNLEKIKAQRYLEESFHHILSHNIIKGRTFSEKESFVSKKFQKMLLESRKYIQKRMNLGILLQESLPFSTILLDQDLKINWANNIFYEEWKLQSLKEKNVGLSWDYISRFTNLGELDPVKDSINNKVSSIHQIQVKLSHESNKVPYEMYISPIDVNDELNIMVFFYPLTSIEETISNQSMSIVNPIKKTLKEIRQGTFTEEFKKNIFKEFELAEIEDIFKELCELSDKETSQKKGLVGEIKKIELERNDLNKLFFDVKNIVEDILKTHSIFITHLGKVKESIINVVEQRNKVSNLIHNQNSFINIIFEKVNFLFKTTEIYKNKITEFIQMVNILNNVRNEVKGYKESLKNSQNSIIQLIDQGMIFQKTNDFNPEKIFHVMSNIKSNIKQFDNIQKKYDKEMVKIDLQISKLDMLLDKDQLENDNQEIFDDWCHFTERLDGHKAQHEELNKNMMGLEDVLVKNLKRIYESFREDNLKVRQIYNIVPTETNKKKVSQKPARPSSFEAQA